MPAFLATAFTAAVSTTMPATGPQHKYLIQFVGVDAATGEVRSPATADLCLTVVGDHNDGWGGQGLELRTCETRAVDADERVLAEKRRLQEFAVPEEGGLEWVDSAASGGRRLCLRRDRCDAASADRFVRTRSRELEAAGDMKAARSLRERPSAAGGFEFHMGECDAEAVVVRADRALVNSPARLQPLGSLYLAAKQPAGRLAGPFRLTRACGVECEDLSRPGWSQLGIHKLPRKQSSRDTGAFGLESFESVQDELGGLRASGGPGSCGSGVHDGFSAESFWFLVKA